MSEFLKKLHAELTEVLGYNEKADASEEKGTDDEDEAPPRTTKKNSKVYTIEQVKKKARQVLENKGVDVAKKILSDFGAEKVGDLEEDDYSAVIDACEKALKVKKKAKDEDEDEDDL